MNRVWRSLLPAMLATCLLLILAACQPAPKVVKSDSGLVPPPGSTGNPPLIPHDVAADDGGATCLGCHRTGEGGAPVTPHPQLVDCRQCHIPQENVVAPFKTSY